MTSSDGGRHWVRVRLRPVDDEHEAGRLTAQQQKQFWSVILLRITYNLHKNTRMCIPILVNEKGILLTYMYV